MRAAIEIGAAFAWRNPIHDSFRQQAACLARVLLAGQPVSPKNVPQRVAKIDNTDKI
jgi:hypothetical protein